MKLAAKITASLAGLTLLALVVEGFAEHRRRADLIAMDVDKDWRLARLLQINVETLWRTQGERGEEMARLLVDATDDATPHRMIQFISFAKLPPDLQLELPARRQQGDIAWRYRLDPTGSQMRYLYVPLAPDGRTVKAAIEAGESLARRDAYLRTARYRKAAVGLFVAALSGLLAVVLGARLVRRPIESLRVAVRALGEGKPLPPVRLDRHDELGELAAELTAVGERLAMRARLQHADRLRTIGQLASGVAHELGTPLAVIGVRARLIADGEVTGAEAAVNGRVILEQSSRMTAIVRQLLEYGRREGSQPAVLDLRHAVTGALGLVGPLAEKHGVTIDFRPPAEPLLVLADQVHLQQVVTNLAINGIQAMAHGGRLQVAVGRGAGQVPAEVPHSAPDWVWLQVSDQGPGIAPEHLPHVFEPFYTTKAIGEGTGLGLAVVQAIVQEQGGWIEVANQPEGGARFTIHLAAAKAAVVPERLAS